MQGPTNWHRWIKPLDPIPCIPARFKPASKLPEKLKLESRISIVELGSPETAACAVVWNLHFAATKIAFALALTQLKDSVELANTLHSPRDNLPPTTSIALHFGACESKVIFSMSTLLSPRIFTQPCSVEMILTALSPISLIERSITIDSR